MNQAALGRGGTVIRKALRSLKQEHAALVGDVVDGRRFFWLGSGISRDQVPDLVAVMERVLLFLRDQAHTGPERAQHRDALLEVLGTYLPPEVARYEADEAGWQPADLEPLRQVYSEVLGVRVGDLPGDYLLMTAADLPNTYGAADLEPGVAHRLLAILIAEGVVKEIASGNWDGLVEAAVVELTGLPGLLDVYVSAEDVRNGNSFAQLAKFHGCAVLARTDPGHYADKIIATRAQISRFDNHAAFEHMRSALKERTTKYRSLILGLSVQDHDLLAVFTRAAENHPWPWEEGHPAYVFAERRIQGSQRDVLENGYGSDYNTQHASIVAGSAFGTYAEPLLAALVIEVLLHKLLALLARQTSVTTLIEADLARGLRRAAALVSASVGNDEKTLLTFATGQYAAFVRQYLGHGANCRYVPMVRAPRTQIPLDLTVPVTGVELLSASIGLLGWGDLQRRWRVRSSPDQTSGNLQLVDRATGCTTHLAVVRGAREADAVLASDAWISDSDRMALLYTHERPRPAPRSPASSLGRGRRLPNRLETCWSDLIAHCSTADEVAERLQAEVGL